METKPFRAPGHKSLSVYPSLNSKRQVQTVANQGRGERGDKGGRAKKQQCSLRDRVLVSPKWVHITLSLNSSAGLKSPPNRKLDEALFISKSQF